MRTVWRLLMDESALPWLSDNGRLAIGWGEIGDIRQFGTFEGLAGAIRERNTDHPDHAGRPEANVLHGSHSLSDFCYAMRPGDLVIVSAGSRRRGVWEVVGEYEYAQPGAFPLNYRHQRAASATKLDADELWHQAGGRLADGQVNYRTLGRCANTVE